MNKKRYLLTSFFSIFLFLAFSYSVFAVHVIDPPIAILSQSASPQTADTSVTITITGESGGEVEHCITDPPEPVYLDVVFSIQSVEIIDGVFKGNTLDITETKKSKTGSCPQGNAKYGSLQEFSASKTFDTSGLAEGTYSMDVEVKNNIGRFDTARVSFTVDHPDPEGIIYVSSNKSTGWTITGPQNFSGSGKTNGSGYTAPTGSYTITADSITGYTLSIDPSSTQTLNDDSSITFTLTYDLDTPPPPPPPMCTQASCGCGVSPCKSNEIKYRNTSNGECGGPICGAIQCVQDDSCPPLPPPGSNNKPNVNAGPNKTVTLPSGAELDGIVNDDGKPSPPAIVTIIWSKFSGPGAVVFSDPNKADTTATFSTDGVYTLRLTANDSQLSNSDDVVVTVNPAPSGTTECSDGLDNDSDTWTDYPKDPGCESLLDDSELNDGYECSDGVDNDGDGLIDGDDSDCNSPTDNTEGNPKFEEF